MYKRKGTVLLAQGKRKLADPVNLTTIIQKEYIKRLKILTNHPERSFRTRTWPIIFLSLFSVTQAITSILICYCKQEGKKQSQQDEQVTALQSLALPHSSGAQPAKENLPPIWIQLHYVWMHQRGPCAALWAWASQLDLKESYKFRPSLSEDCLVDYKLHSRPRTIFICSAL